MPPANNKPRTSGSQMDPTYTTNSVQISSVPCPVVQALEQNWKSSQHCQSRASSNTQPVVFFFPCPNWSPNKTDSSMVGPAKKSRFRFDNRAAWCNIKRIQRKLGQVFLQVMAVLCSIIIQLWNCVNFKCWALVQCSIHPPTRKNKCTCHICIFTIITRYQGKCSCSCPVVQSASHGTSYA